MKKKFGIIISSIILLVIILTTLIKKSPMEDLTQEEWAEQLANDDNAVVLDVRTDAEVADGIIPNAIHIDIYKGEEFLEEIEELDKDKSYYVYCRSGNRSGKACEIMEELGFEKAYNLEGGFMQWTGEIVDID